MDSFWIALQFLTRIHIVHRDHWDMEDFGKSVPYFAFIGIIIGILSTIVYLLSLAFLNQELAALFTIIFQFLITGGLHADGFMDTSDGLFSGRDRERKLEIMKDSRVGSNGVVGFVFLTLLKWQTLAALPPYAAIPMIILITAYSKCGIVMSIRLYPYARKEGMGKAFAYLSPSSSLPASFFTIIIATALMLWMNASGTYFIALFFLAIAFNLTLNSYCTKHLGGLTGDTYGFVSEATECLLLLSYVLLVSTHSGFLLPMEMLNFTIFSIVLAGLGLWYRSRVLKNLVVTSAE